MDVYHFNQKLLGHQYQLLLSSSYFGMWCSSYWALLMVSQQVVLHFIAQVNQQRSFYLIKTFSQDSFLAFQTYPFTPKMVEIDLRMTLYKQNKEIGCWDFLFNGQPIFETSFIMSTKMPQKCTWVVALFCFALLNISCFFACQKREKGKNTLESITMHGKNCKFSYAKHYCHLMLLCSESLMNTLQKYLCYETERFFFFYLVQVFVISH